MTDERRVTLRHRLEFAAVRALSFLVGIGGPAFGRLLAVIVGSAIWVVAERRRRIVELNLDIAFGDTMTAREKRGIGRRSSVSMVQIALEMMLRRTRSDHSWIQCTEDPPYATSLDTETPNGLLYLSAHHGNWELGHWWCGQRGKPCLTIGRTLDNPLLEAWVSDSRGAHESALSINKPGAFLRVAKRLAQGGTVALVVDQNNRHDPLFVPFFGVEAAFHMAWAKLALRLRPRVVFCVSTRQGFGRFHYLARELFIPESGTEEERARALVEAYGRALEEAIRVNPDQYLWSHQRYRTRPPGEPPIYPVKRRRQVEPAPSPSTAGPQSATKELV